MDFRLLASTFLAVFLAELGDKTQLATMTLAATNASRWSVFFGAAAALVCTTVLGVLVGANVTRFVSPLVLRRVAGAVFLLMGIYYVATKS